MPRAAKGWSSVHQKVFDLNIKGVPAKEIAEKVGINVKKVYDIVDNKGFREKKEKLVVNAVDKARKTLESKLIIAANKIVNIMQFGKPEDRLRFDAAKEILYQCGMKPVEVVETRTRECRPEELQSALGVVREIQTIEEKLSTQGSEFLVKKETDEPSLPAVPVQAGEAKMLEVTEEVAVA